MGSVPHVELLERRSATASLSNPEIAERLVPSVRTVARHVSAILAELGVSSRREAAARHAP